ncbi:thiol reductant ABC exporter subunit CydC [Propionibacteriaceae bacterium Y1923]
MNRTSAWGLVTELLRGVPKGRRRFALATLLAALASMSSVALVGTAAWLISFAALAPPVLYLQAAAVLVRAFGIARSAFRYVERLVGHDLVLRMQSALRLRVYDKLSGTTLVGRRRGDLLTRVVADVAAIQDVVVRVAIPALSASLVVTATTIILATFNAASALVLFVTAVLGGVVVPLLAQRATLRLDEAAAPTRGRLADEVREFSRTAQDLVAYGATDRALDRVLEVDEQLRRQEAGGAWVRGIAAAGQVLAAGVAVVAALLIGAPALLDGSMDARYLAVLVLTPLALHEVFNTFAQAAQTWTRSRSALRRIAETLDAADVGSGDAEPAGEAGEGLVLSGVSVGWPGGEALLSGLDLAVRPGERVALVGASGVGKTTVAATVMGLIPPLGGEVLRGGRVGYLAQDAHIFATSVAENVKIGHKDASDDEVRRALERAGLDLDPARVVGEGGAGLSGGERRRLAFARVVVGERDLLILDEPTEHLDHETAERLVNDVFAATADKAVLVLTHDRALIERCDRVVELVPAAR